MAFLDDANSVMLEHPWRPVGGRGRIIMAAAALLACAAPTEMVCGCPPSRSVVYVSGQVVDPTNRGVAGARITFGAIAVTDTVRAVFWPQSDALQTDSLGRFATRTYSGGVPGPKLLRLAVTRPASPDTTYFVAGVVPFVPERARPESLAVTVRVP